MNFQTTNVHSIPENFSVSNNFPFLSYLPPSIAWSEWVVFVAVVCSTGLWIIVRHGLHGIGVCESGMNDPGVFVEIDFQLVAKRNICDSFSFTMWKVTWGMDNGWDKCYFDMHFKPISDPQNGSKSVGVFHFGDNKTVGNKCEDGKLL